MAEICCRHKQKPRSLASLPSNVSAYKPIENSHSLALDGGSIYFMVRKKNNPTALPIFTLKQNLACR